MTEWQMQHWWPTVSDEVCKWCGEGYYGSHSDCTERVQRIWDSTYVRARADGSYSPIADATMAVEALEGRLFRG